MCGSPIPFTADNAALFWRLCRQKSCISAFGPRPRLSPVLRTESAGSPKDRRSYFDPSADSVVHAPAGGEHAIASKRESVGGPSDFATLHFFRAGFTLKQCEAP